MWGEVTATAGDTGQKATGRGESSAQEGARPWHPRKWPFRKEGGVAKIKYAQNTGTQIK